MPFVPDNKNWYEQDHGRSADQIDAPYRLYIRQNHTEQITAVHDNSSMKEIRSVLRQLRVVLTDLMIQPVERHAPEQQIQRIQKLR